MNKSSLYSILFLVLLFTVFIGCEYDAPTSVWNQPYEEGVSPSISEIEPTVAVAGENFITIKGTNFSSKTGGNSVYFDNLQGEVIAESATEIVVRRPNLVGDSIYINVVSNDGLLIAKFGPYKIDSVMEELDTDVLSADLALTAAAVDASGNVYVFQKIPNEVLLLSQTGERATPVGSTKKSVTDAKVGPDGYLYYLVKDKPIYRMNPADGKENQWKKASKRIEYLDFTEDGVLFAGGSKSDILAFNKMGMESKPANGAYSNFDIDCLRVYNGYVYVLALDKKHEEGNPLLAIWRNEILSATGSLGPKELVYDWANAGELAESTPLCFDFNASGDMYIGTDDSNPIFVLYANGTQDVFYKTIIPAAAVDLVWYDKVLYEVQYKLEVGSDANTTYSKVYKIPMTEEGAPYWGRTL